MKQTLGKLVRPTLGRLVRGAFCTRVHGAENIPVGGALLAGNHLSYLDPVLLWCAAPRPVRFMAKSELWDVRVLAWALPRLWAFPVMRGGADRAAIEAATGFLKAGELVGIFPEGTRAEADATELGEAHGGAAFIAMRAGVPVVPTAFVGTDAAMPRGARLPRLRRVDIWFGEPVRPEDFVEGSRKERVAAMTAAIMRRIGEGLAQAKEAGR